jgi:uncharacterized repeat protein (TIGR03803 family)
MKWMAAFFAISVFGPGCSPLSVPSSPPLTSPASLLSRSTVKYKDLFDFDGADGSSPAASLVAVNGALYGTAPTGGKYGHGVVFRVNAAGDELAIYSLKGSPNDGAAPKAPLLDVHGTLYGTTTGGGTGSCTSGKGRRATSGSSNGCGTVFSINTSGKERVIYSFKGGKDGAYPVAPVIDVNGILYGTTYGGGEGSLGTVFSLTTNGSEGVLFSFPGGNDGISPDSGLVHAGDQFYGTTFTGGYSASSSSLCYAYAPGCGIVYAVSASGKERVLHQFKGGPRDGAFPVGLTYANGILYGTTAFGGRYSCVLGSGLLTGCGTVFSLTPTGKEALLHSFDGSDGYRVESVPIFVRGNLYGTVYAGGKGKCYDVLLQLGGCGTIFEANGTGKTTILYNFKGSPGDGEYSLAGLLDLGGTFYGTTAGGGSYGTSYGEGTVFSLTP